MRLSIIVPVLDEAAGIVRHLQALGEFRARGAEIIVVDGGSSDGTADKARDGVDVVILGPRGRARQMNAGADAAEGEILLFLHADTRLPHHADNLISYALTSGGKLWGRFDVQIRGQHPLLPTIARMMNRRSRLTGIATGDQGIFVRADTFRTVGGYPDLPLMEDIVLSKKLKALGPPACLHQTASTSGRRWERKGVLRTIATMWGLRLAFRLGVSPNRLARFYGYDPGTG